MHPYLAQSLPQLNTDSWRVFPDGRMETTYRLRSNLTWHDGTPLSAEDFVFAWRVYSVPELGWAASPPIVHIEEAVAADPNTLVIRWRQPYADAGSLDAGEGTSSRVFTALPRHSVSPSFGRADWDTFAALPFWTTEYLGLGPFRLDNWEPGSHFEGVAFDGHALGRPKINRFRMRFTPDFNTTVAAMLAGDVHLNVDDSLRLPQGLILEREWATRNGGTVLVYPGLWRWTMIQQRPELAQPRALMDVRVRQALSHSVDKDGINQALFDGRGVMSETAIPSNVEYFADLDRAVVKYPYDPLRTEQLMSEAGFSRGQDGVYIDSAGRRFTTELAVLQSPANESEMAVMAAGWRSSGYDVKEVVWPAVAARNSELRNTHSGLSSTGGRNGEDSLAEHSTPRIPSVQNHWNGSNRGGWVAPAEFDRLAQVFPITLDRSARTQMIIEMARLFTENAAVISLYFSPTVTAFAAGLTGPEPPLGAADVAWNVAEWSFR
jgi:peptide/nickel transport system substrate-binding protein